MLSFEKIDLDFTKDSLNMIAQEALDKKIGARGLRSILDNLFLDTLFQINKEDSGTKLKVTTQTDNNKKVLTIVKKEEKKGLSSTSKKEKIKI